jgi:uncharacterized protein
MTPPLRLGAPGIYRQPLRAGPRLDLPRMDVCAFVGVAPRGPVREPKLDETWRFDRPCVEPDRPRRRSVAVPIESFSEYRRLFGGLQGPGRLPLSVALFFQQGGQRAYIVRIVHDYGESDPKNSEGVASGPLAGAISSEGTFRLQARSEGTWGNAIRAAIGFSVTPLSFDHFASDIHRLVMDEGHAVPVGSLLRVTAGGQHELRFVDRIQRRDFPDQVGHQLELIFRQPLTESPEFAEVVEGELRIDD